MSILGMMEGKPAFLGVGGAEHQPTHFSDVVGAAFQSGVLNNSKDRSVNDAQRERDDKYKSLTGRDIYNDVIDTSPDRSTLQAEYMAKDATGTGRSQKLQDATDAYVSGLRQNDPERYKDIGTSADILQRAKQRTLDAEAHSSEVNAGAGTAAHYGGELVGGFGAGMFDPVNIAAMGLSIPGTSGIIKVALREAAINGGISAVSSPLTAGWRKELGKEYGPGEWATDTAVGALFGGTMGVLAHGAGAALSKSKSYMFSKFADAFGLRDNPEAATAAKMESRRTHLDESNPALLQADVPVASGERPIAVDTPVPRQYDPELLQGLKAELDAAAKDVSNGRRNTSRMQAKDIELMQAGEPLGDHRTGGLDNFNKRYDEYVARKSVAGTSTPSTHDKLAMTEAHNQSLAEVDAAVNEGRAIKRENIPFTDEQIRQLDRSKMEPGLADFHERATDETPLAPSDARPQVEKNFNEHGVRTYAPEDISLLKRDIEQGAGSAADVLKATSLAKEEALKLIDRKQKGLPITDKQSAKLADLHDGMQEHYAKQVDPHDAAEKLGLTESPKPTVEGTKSLEEMYHSPEMIAKEHADFEEAFKGDDSTEIALDDGTKMTIKEMRESFKSDDEFLSAVSVCGIGGK